MPIPAPMSTSQELLLRSFTIISKDYFNGLTINPVGFPHVHKIKPFPISLLRLGQYNYSILGLDKCVLYIFVLRNLQRIQK